MAVPGIREWLSIPQTSVEVYADLYEGTKLTAYTGLPVSGTLTMSRTATAVRTASAVFNTTKPREVALGLAKGWRAKLYVRVTENGPYTVPLGVFRATSARWLDSEPAVTADLSDEMLLVAECGYTSPYTCKKGWEIWGSIELTCAVPGVAKKSGTSNRAKLTADTAYGSISQTRTLRSAVTSDRSRVDSLAVLENLLSVRVFYDAAGVLSVRRHPWLYWMSRAGADYRLDAAGDDALFNLGEQGFERSSWFNQLVIQPQSTTSKFWSVSKKIPASAQYGYSDLFGGKPRFYSDEDIKTKREAQAVIGDMLVPSTRPQHQLTVISPPYWWIEPGKVLALPAGTPKATAPRYVVDAVTLPLGLGDMQITATSLDTIFYSDGEGSWDV